MAVGKRNKQVISMTSAADLLTGMIFVQEMRWLADTSGDDLEVRDGEGTPIWKSVAEADNFIDAIHFGGTAFKDVTVHTIDSGTLYVYVE